MQEIDIDKIKILIPPELHYKKEDSKVDIKVKSFISKNGQLKNIVVKELQQGKYTVVEGRRIFLACKELKFKKIWCAVIPTATNSDIISLQLNETRGEADFLKISQVLNKLNKTIQLKDLISQLPFEQALVKPLIELIKFDWTKIRKKQHRTQGQLFNTDELIAEKKQEEVEVNEEQKKRKSRTITRHEYPCNDCINDGKDYKKQLDDKHKSIICTKCMEVISYER